MYGRCNPNAFKGRVAIGSKQIIAYVSLTYSLYPANILCTSAWYIFCAQRIDMGFETLLKYNPNVS